MNIKPVILKSKLTEEGKTNIKIRIVHQRKTREIATKYYIEVTPKFNPWDAKNNKLKKEFPGSAFINAELKKIVLEYEQKLLGQPTENWPIEKVLAFLKSSDENNDVARFYTYFEKFIARKSTENARTSQLYTESLSKIKGLIKHPNPTFKDISVTVLKELESDMREQGLKTNTISIHLKNIRAVFNSAIDEEVISQDVYPFRRMTIKYESTPSKALTIEQMISIRDLKLDNEYHAQCRDVFMLSFYLIGINNGDLYEVKEIGADGRIRYSRAKTHRQYSIKVEPEALKLIERLKGMNRLINLADRYKNTKTLNKQLNLGLKEIGRKMGVPDLIMYHARHTWATIAARLEVPKETIAAALGHSGGTVTDIYISFDEKKIDEANRKVVDAIK